MAIQRKHILQINKSPVQKFLLGIRPKKNHFIF